MMLLCGIQDTVRHRMIIGKEVHDRGDLPDVPRRTKVCTDADWACGGPRGGDAGARARVVGRRKPQ